MSVPLTPTLGYIMLSTTFENVHKKGIDENEGTQEEIHRDTNLRQILRKVRVTKYMYPNYNIVIKKK